MSVFIYYLLIFQVFIIEIHEVASKLPFTQYKPKGPHLPAGDPQCKLKYARSEEIVERTLEFAEPKVRLLLGKHDSLCVYNMKTGRSDDCIPKDPSGIQLLDYHFSKSLIFYKSNSQGIKRIKLPLSKSKAEDVTVESHRNVVSVTVDWVYNKLYLNYNGDTLKRTDLQGKNEATVITSNQIYKFVSGPPNAVLKLNGVQVDPYQQYIFIKYTTILNEKEQSVSIIRSGFDGNNLKQIYSTINPTLTDFTIDVSKSLLYIKENQEVNITTYEGTTSKTYSLSPSGDYEVSPTFHVALDSFYSLGRPANEKEFLHLLSGELKPFFDNYVQLKHTHFNTGHVTSLKVYDVKVQQGAPNKSHVCENDCNLICGTQTTGPNHHNIIGGSVSKQGQFPWHAILYKRVQKNHDVWNAVCGGTLITHKVVLTAAHCVTVRYNKDINPKDITVALGKIKRNLTILEDCEEKRLAVNEVIRHNLYNDVKGYKEAYDIAVLILEKCIPLNKYVLPACVDYSLQNVEDIVKKAQTIYVPGLGNTKPCSKRGYNCNSPSPILVFHEGRLVSNIECLNTSLSLAVPKTTDIDLTPDNYCAGNGTVSPMQEGDSGGGVILKFNDRHYVHGVVSKKVKSRGEEFFSALTNVTEHIDWVKQFICTK